MKSWKSPALSTRIKLKRKNFPNEIFFFWSIWFEVRTQSSTHPYPTLENMKFSLSERVMIEIWFHILSNEIKFDSGNPCWNNCQSQLPQNSSTQEQLNFSYFCFVCENLIAFTSERFFQELKSQCFQEKKQSNKKRPKFNLSPHIGAIMKFSPLRFSTEESFALFSFLLTSFWNNVPNIHRNAT